MHCAKFGWNWPSDYGEENKNVRRKDEQIMDDKFNESVELSV